MTTSQHLQRTGGLAGLRRRIQVALQRLYGLQAIPIEIVPDPIRVQTPVAGRLASPRPRDR
jgi:hypothetical protein